MRYLIFFVFFLSGLSALGLETLWTRLFSLVFGGTALATVTVLTAYMAGLAWGSAWGGKRADRMRRPLLVYAWLEAGIGLWGMLMPFWIDLIAPLHQWTTGTFPPTVVAFFRFVLATLTMLVPTAMMGATLPVLSRIFTKKAEDIGFEVGILYTVNTAGAVTGCLLTGFFFLPSLGVQSTIFVLGGLNLFLAAAMGWYGRNLHVVPIEPEHEHEDKSEEQEGNPADEINWQRFQITEPKVVLFAFAISGGLAMLCQVCWNRVLTLVIGSSIYAFTIILSTFLLGLTAGSSVGSWWSRRMKAPSLWLAWALALTAGLVWGSVVLVDQLPLAFLYLAQSKELTPTLLFSIKALLASMLVFVPTFSMGLMFPFVIRGYFQRGQPIGQTVGKVYAYNTVGAILGSFTAGFVWIPWLGIQGSLLLVTFLYLSLALVVLFFREQPNPVRAQVAVLSMVGLLAILSLFFTPAWNRSHLSLGLFRIAQLKRLNPSKLLPRKLLSYHEGLHATVVIEQYDKHVIALKVNGKADASSGVDMPTQMLSALLPLSLHGNAKQVLVIGWGSGVTVGTALQFPLQQVTAVEIEPAVVKAAAAFQPWNYKPRQDKRLKLVYDDGRNYLHSQRKSYDVVISEPSNPWISGVSALFTQEFFKLALRRLKPGGVLCQWIQLYELSPRSIRVLLRTVSSVFPYVYLFGISQHSRDTLLIATQSPLRKTLSSMKTWFRQPKIRQAFLRAGMRGPMDLLPRLIADNESIRRLVRHAPLNTDDNAWIELRAPLHLLTHATSDGSAYLRKALGPQYNRFQRVFPSALKVRSAPCIPPSNKEAKLLLARLRFGDLERGQKDFKRLCPHTKPSLGYLFARDLDTMLHQGYPRLEACWKQAGQQNNHLRAIACWNQHSRSKISPTKLRSWAQKPKTSPEYRTLFGVLQYARRESWLSLQLLTPLVKHPKWLQRYPLLYYVLGQLNASQKVWPEAVWFTGHYLSARGPAP